MTTTHVYEGIFDGSRSSSRVLKPPGGGSSISFGDGNDDYTMYRKGGYTPLKSKTTNGVHKEVAKPVVEEPVKTPSEEVTPESTDAAKATSPVAEVSEASPVESEPAAKETSSTETSPVKAEEPKQNGSATASAPAPAPTPAPAPAPAPAPVEAPQRRRIPPGGFSSKLW